MHTKTVLPIVISALLGFLPIGANPSIPEDVEILDDEYPVVSKLGPKTNDDVPEQEFVKAIRNRRDLKHYIKAIPKSDTLFKDDVVKEPIFDDIPRHLIKRDLENIANIDVLYTEQLAIDRIANIHKSKRNVNENVKENEEEVARPEIEWYPNPESNQDIEFLEVHPIEKHPENKREEHGIAVAEA